MVFWQALPELGGSARKNAKFQRGLFPAPASLALRFAGVTLFACNK
jgi:hypothetical protein